MKAKYESIEYMQGSSPPRLRIRLSVINDSGHEAILFGFKGQLRIPVKEKSDVKSYFVYVGELNDINNQVFTMRHEQLTPLELSFVLDPYTKEIIEDRRIGDLEFYLYISAYRIQVDAPRINIQNEQCQVVTDTGLNYIKIPRSLWVDFLQEAGYNKFQIIEIPIDYSDIISNAKKFKQQGIEDRFKKAAQQLEIVMKKMDEGNWADAVGECRLVIDNFRKGTVKDDDGGEISPLKIIEKILKRSGFPPENVEGFKQMIERIYAYSSMKYHIKVNGEDEEIIIPMGREDALFVVSNTVTILNLLTRKYISIKK